MFVGNVQGYLLLKQLWRWRLYVSPKRSHLPASSLSTASDQPSYQQIHMDNIFVVN